MTLPFRSCAATVLLSLLVFPVNAAPAIIVDPTVLNLPEPDGVGDFNVSLNQQPTGNVTISVSDEDNGSLSDVTVESPPGSTPPNTNVVTLTFTPGNYATPQAVRVRVLDDNSNNDGNSVTLTARVATTTDVAFASAPTATITVNIQDNEIASSIVVDKLVLNLREPNGHDDIAINLSEPPSANVTVNVTDEENGPASDVTVESPPGSTPSETNIATLTFTPGNYATPQSVRVRALNDSSVNGTHSVTLTARANSTDGNYRNAPPVNIAVNIADDDVVSVKLTESGATQVAETSDLTFNDSYTVELTSGIGASETVTITPIVTPAGQVTLSPNSITFNSSTDTTPQTFTVRAVNDSVAEPARQTVTITHTATTNPAGGAYDGAPVASVTVTITDDDSPNLAFSETGGTTQVRGDAFASYPDPNGSDSYTVYLTTRPLHPVTITLTSSDGLLVEPDTVTFNAGEEGIASNKGKPVKVTATEPAFGPSYVEHSIASLDTSYSSLPVQEFAVCRVHQDEAAGVVATNCVEPIVPKSKGVSGGAFEWLTLGLLFLAGRGVRRRRFAGGQVIAFMKDSRNAGDTSLSARTYTGYWSAPIAAGLLAVGSAVHAESLHLWFTPDPSRPTTPVSGTAGWMCPYDGSMAIGTLSATPPEGDCRGSTLGPSPATTAANDRIIVAGPGSVFLSDPFPAGLHLAGPITIFARISKGGADDMEPRNLYLALDQILEDGSEWAIGQLKAIPEYTPDGNMSAGHFNIGPYYLLKGSRLRLRLGSTTGLLDSLLYGAGPEFNGLSLTTGWVNPVKPAPVHVETFLAFTPIATPAAAVSADGCELEEDGFAGGLLTASSEATHCRSGQWGSEPGSGLDLGFRSLVARFVMPRSDAPLVITDKARLVVYYAAAHDPSFVLAGQSRHGNVWYRLDEYVMGDGSTRTLAHGLAFEISSTPIPSIQRHDAILDLPRYTLSPGNRLALILTSDDVPEGRLLYGGTPLASTPYPGARISYADAGLTLNLAASPAPEERPPLPEEPPPSEEPAPGEQLPVEESEPEEPPPSEEPAPGEQLPVEGSEPGEEPPQNQAPSSGGQTGAGDRTLSGALPVALLLPLLLSAFHRRRFPRHCRGALLASTLLALSGPALAGDFFLAFTPDPNRSGAPTGPSQECFFETGEARGGLKSPPIDDLCHIATLGSEPSYAGTADGDTTAQAGVPSQFLSAPFAGGMALGGYGRIVIDYTNNNDGHVVGKPAPNRPLNYSLEEVSESGDITPFAGGEVIEQLRNGRNEGAFHVPGYTLAAGSRLRVLIGSPDPDGAAGWISYGDGHADSGVTFVSANDGGGGFGGVGGGAIPPALLLAMVVALVARIRRIRALPVNSRSVCALLAVALSFTGAFSVQANPTPNLDVAVAIAVFAEKAPTASDIQALRDLGLQAQPLRQLPMVIVRGTAAQFEAARAAGLGISLYANEPVVYDSVASNARIGVDKLQKLGFTGKGMQIAIVDSGLDATHPDLAERVVHNVQIIGPEEAGQPADSPPGPLYIPFDEGPYSNTDIGNGHGTMCAGIMVASGRTLDSQVGVAPDADLIGYSSAAALELASVVAAFDHILDHPDWGIDVVNNSWHLMGRIGQPFDPLHPVSVATEKLTDRGIVVVFAAANRGSDNSEMTLNGAIAPWNILVANTDMDDTRFEESSNGLETDNSLPIAIVNGHARFEGNRLGLYHPNFAAPGHPITTSCTPTGLFHSTGCTPGGTRTSSGTSFSAPHVAGVVALLRQAHPGLTVKQVRMVLEATAAPTKNNAAFWQVGYGRIDAKAAMDLVQSKKFERDLERAHAAATARVLASRDWEVQSSDFWHWTPPAEPYTRALEFQVPPGADAVKVVLAYSWPDYGVGNITSPYRFTVHDPAGVLMATGTHSFFWSVTALVDLRDAHYAPGTWSVNIDADPHVMERSGQRSAMAVASILTEAPPAPVPEFEARGQLTLLFTPDPERRTGIISPEGCETEPGQAIGMLEVSPPAQPCHTASHGWIEYPTELPAEFTSQPLSNPIVIGGSATLVAHIADPPRSLGESPVEGRFDYWFDALAPDGTQMPLSNGETLHGLVDGRNEGGFEVAPLEVPAGYRLRLRLKHPIPTTSAARLLFGGEQYGDAGITLTTGRIKTPKTHGKGRDKVTEETGPAAGALGAPLLLILGGAALFAVLVAAKVQPRVRANSFM